MGRVTGIGSLGKFSFPAMYLQSAGPMPLNFLPSKLLNSKTTLPLCFRNKEPDWFSPARLGLSQFNFPSFYQYISQFLEARQSLPISWGTNEAAYDSQRVKVIYVASSIFPNSSIFLTPRSLALGSGFYPNTIFFAAFRSETGSFA